MTWKWNRGPKLEFKTAAKYMDHNLFGKSHAFAPAIF